MNRSRSAGRSAGHAVSIATILACRALLPSSIMAQGPVAIGPAIGYSFGVPLTVDRAPGTVNRYGSQRSGSSYDHALWFGADLLASDLLGDRWDLSAELGLAVSAGRFTSDPFTFGVFYDSATAAFVAPLRQFDVSSSLSALQLDLAAGRRLDDRWSYRVGLWLQYRLTSDFAQHESLLDLPDITFSDGTRSHVVSAGEALGGGRLRYGPLLSGALRMPLADGLALMPHIDLRLDLPALLDNLRLRSLRGGAGLALLLDYGRASSPSSVEEELRLPLPDRPRPRLDADISLYSVGPGSEKGEAAVIRPHELLQRRVIPFDSLIRFDPDSVGIPNRYRRLTPAEASAFSSLSLARLEPLALRSELLNVLGLRLRDDPASRVTLAYSVGEMMAERAAAVRGYLRDIWGIEERRMEVRPDRRGRGARAGDRYVAIGSTDAELFAPIVSEWIIRELRVPPLGMSQHVEAEAGLRAWSLTITRGAVELARYDGTRASELRSVDLSLRLDGRSTEGTAPLVATLTVIDSVADTLTVRDTLALRRDTDAAARATRARYVLTREGDAEPIVGMAVADMRAGAVVTIASLTGAFDPELERVAALFLAGLRARGIAPGELHVRRASAGEESRSLPPDAAIEITVEEGG